MSAARLALPALVAFVTMVAIKSPHAQTALPPGPAVPLPGEPATRKPPPSPGLVPAVPPAAAPPTTGTLSHAITPAGAPVPPPPPVPPGPATGGPSPTPGVGSLPVSNKPSNLTAADTTSPIAPPLPEPALDENASPAAFLRAARAALLAGKTGEAQEALERAESRALDRAVRRSQANTPSGQSLVKAITAARQSLAGPDREKSLDLIDVALRDRAAGVR